MGKRTPPAAALLVMTALLGFAAACASKTSGTPSGGALAVASRDESRRLAPAEILEYRGEKLGSVDDFRENSIAGPQAVDLASYRLVVDGLVNEPLSLSYREALAFGTSEKVIELNCVEGWSVKALWAGPLVMDIVDAARPRPSATTLILEAVDGYTTALPLSWLRERRILLASSINGVILPPERGFPFQLAAEEKWGFKWIKWVTRLTLSDDASYRGTYEQKGFNSDGSIWGPKSDISEEPGMPGL